jgi:hypothetical protein
MKRPTRNKYAAICQHCKRTVAVGDGWLTRELGAWNVHHTYCYGEDDSVWKIYKYTLDIKGVQS